MGVLGKLFGSTYEDDKLVMAAERAIAQDPVMNNPGAVGVVSDKGVVMLSGTVNSEREKRHVENLIRSNLNNSKLKYADIDNRLKVL
ncbi:BON domain-containing protein [bacterium]|nr:BON domain-containing protein [bacterium]